MTDLSKIFKAYDIRGVVPDELDEDVAEAVGAAFVRLTGAGEIVVTCTTCGPPHRPLAAAFGRGATAQGADVIDAGLGSTDMLYYASGTLGMPGAMITASHNPARYNGIKLCRAGAKPVGQRDRPGRAARDDRGGRARQRRPGRAGRPAGTCCPATPST